MLRRLGEWYSRRSRKRRGLLFRELLRPGECDRILDLGSLDGSYFANVVPFRENVYIADISSEVLERGKRAFGFNTILLAEDGHIPVPDGFFDVVWCSAVIEHVTVDKSELLRYQTGQGFREESFVRQECFAREIRRVGKSYFVHTANKYFPIEGHTWLPMPVVLLPRRWLVRLIRFQNKWWPKKDGYDWSLLTYRDMRALFPDAEIVREKSLGFVKSLIAVKRPEESTVEVGDVR